MRERVLITGARAPAALTLARSFAAAGLEVHMADCCPAYMARASRTPTAVHAYASPRLDPQGFARDISGLVEALAPKLIVPTCEEVFRLATVARDHGYADTLFAPAPAILAGLHSKHRFAQICCGLGLPVPDTVRVTTPLALCRATTGTVERVVKREFSRFGARTFIAPAPAELSRIQPSDGEPWVVQDRIVGDEISFYAVCLGGRLTAFSAYRSTWRLPGGAGYAFEALAPLLYEALRDWASILAEVVGQGQFACDVIVDRSGAPWLLECNPRSTSGVFLFSEPAALARSMSGSGVAEAVVPACDLRAAMWRFGLPKAARQGRLADWWRQVRSGRDVIGGPHDPMPVAGALLDTLVFAMRGRRAGCSLREAMTADIEWNGQAF